jgi:NET1-associated nuclear protein 1 (U3 small nucleolar RNA-associated protein 17)
MIIGGQSYVSAPPAFSADGRLLLVCSGLVVSVFSTSTAMLVSPARRRRPHGTNWLWFI